MGWRCYIVERVKLNPHVEDKIRPGIYFTEMYRIPGTEALLSFRELKVGAIWQTERGLRIKLPGSSGHNSWDMEQPANQWENGKIVAVHRWTVTGTAPDVTATPSINCVGVYHGFVTNGEVTEDCEGRKFDDFGHLIS